MSGWKCAARDCAQICSSKQTFGEVETCSEFFTAPKESALEHCEIDNVAGSSLELERVDDCTKAQRDKHYEKECENDSERDRSEESPVDGIGPVVETLALDWSPLDREVQHERSDCYHRASAQLGWSCCQNGLRGNLREGLEMSGISAVEMATAPLERSRERQMVWSAPKTIQNLEVGGHGVDGRLQDLWKRRWFCGISPTVYRVATFCSGSWAMAAVRKKCEKPDLVVVTVMTQWGYTSRLGRSKRTRPTGGKRIPLVASNGVEWW